MRSTCNYAPECEYGIDREPIDDITYINNIIVSKTYQEIDLLLIE